MHIRRAGDGDIDLVGRLRIAFLADHRGLDPATFDPAFVERTRAFVADHHAAGDLLTWLAQDTGPGDGRGTCVGIVSMLLRAVPPRPDDPGTVEGYLVNLYVEPESRRRGIGRRLLDECLDHARVSSMRRLVLHATADGRPMYEQVGFTPNDAWMELPVGATGAVRPA